MNKYEPLRQPIVLDTWDEKYRYREEPNWAATCERVVGALCRGRETDEFAERALQAMEAREIVPAGRVLAGAGADARVTWINCFVSDAIQDSMRTDPGEGRGIMDTLARAAYTQQMGGGIGMDFSTIRPRGARVFRTNTVSSGVLPFMDMWDAMCATIRSSGSRRGAQMGVLGVWHPDVEEFIEAKRQPGRLTNFNVSVAVTDAFMDAVRVDAEWPLVFSSAPSWDAPDVEGCYVYRKVRARELWGKLTEATYACAEPGVLFVDRVNALNNLYYCEDIRCTNPCFTGDTLVWTIAGPRRFDELARAREPVPVLTQLADGRLAYREMVRPRMTQRRAELVEVTLSGSGRRRTTTAVRCTPDHVFHLVDGTERRAADLNPRDRIASAYRSKNNKGYFRIFGAHEGLQEHWLVAEYKYGRRPDYPREHVHHINEVKGDNRPDNIELLASFEHNALNMRGDRNPVRRFPKKNHFANVRFTGKKNGMFGRKHSAETRAKIGAKTRERNADPAYRASWREACGRNHRVVSVRHLREQEDVYCGTVPSTGRFFVWCGADEGVLVSNCGEQPLPSNGCCNLGHVNYAAMVDAPFTPRAQFRFDKLDRAASIMVRLLDDVLDATPWPLPEQDREAWLKRRVGLGFTGLGTALQLLGLRYGSSEAVEFTRLAGATLAWAAYKESCELARERGPFPLYDEEKFCAAPFVRRLDGKFRVSERIRRHGIRNGVLLSVAPTGTTSLVLGNVSSGVEPVFAHRYRRRVRGSSGMLDTEYSVFDYGFLKLCEREGADPETFTPGASEDHRGFVTADQLTVEDHLQMAAAAQEWVDAAVSKTINCPASMTLDEFRKVYDRAYALGLKGCTTYRPDPRSGRGAVLVAEPREEKTDASEEASEEASVEASVPVRSGAEEGRSGAEEEARPQARLSCSEGTEDTVVAASAAPGDKVPMQDVAEGRRYRIRWPTEDCAYYVMITDYVDASGRRRPFELFISTKSERHSEWVRAFSLLVTAIFRREGDASFVVDELRSVFSAAGGAWLRVPWDDRTKFVPSLVAAVGLKIEEHMRWLGLMGGGEQLAPERADPAPPPEAAPAPAMLAVCDQCGARAVVYSQGCSTCLACGKSDCG